MVLDAGSIVSDISPPNLVIDAFCSFLVQVEFDSPRELLKVEQGRLRSLVDESADREHLYEMANARA
jgi:hypothetical protein